MLEYILMISQEVIVLILFVLSCAQLIFLVRKLKWSVFKQNMSSYLMPTFSVVTFYLSLFVLFISIIEGVVFVLLPLIGYSLSSHFSVIRGNGWGTLLFLIYILYPTLILYTFFTTLGCIGLFIHKITSGSWKRMPMWLVAFLVSTIALLSMFGLVIFVSDFFDNVIQRWISKTLTLFYREYDHAPSPFSIVFIYLMFLIQAIISVAYAFRLRGRAWFYWFLALIHSISFLISFGVNSFFPYLFIITPASIIAAIVYALHGSIHPKKIIVTGLIMIGVCAIITGTMIGPNIASFIRYGIAGEITLHIDCPECVGDSQVYKMTELMLCSKNTLSQVMDGKLSDPTDFYTSTRQEFSFPLCNAGGTCLPFTCAVNKRGNTAVIGHEFYSRPEVCSTIKIFDSRTWTAKNFNEFKTPQNCEQKCNSIVTANNNNFCLGRSFESYSSPHPFVEKVYTCGCVINTL